mmetsp:Transcript_9557/g.26783  ORF Transcript_9557/g.26783 Transcript_9557/m.26783 type:complete len:214 (+) Transcript_9557:505-1146(+)
MRHPAQPGAADYLHLPLPECRQCGHHHHGRQHRQPQVPVAHGPLQRSVVVPPLQAQPVVGRRGELRVVSGMRPRCPRRDDHRHGHHERPAVPRLVPVRGDGGPGRGRPDPNPPPHEGAGAQADPGPDTESHPGPLDISDAEAQPHNGAQPDLHQEEAKEQVLLVAGPQGQQDGQEDLPHSYPGAHRQGQLPVDVQFPMRAERSGQPPASGLRL